MIATHLPTIPGIHKTHTVPAKIREKEEKNEKNNYLKQRTVEPI
jgi:hypothetical protein